MDDCLGFFALMFDSVVRAGDRGVAVVGDLVGASDWTQFLPDIVAAVPTGLLVGAVLWVIQLRRESWEQRRRSRVGMKRLVHPLLLELQRPVAKNENTRIRKLGSKRVRAMMLIEKSELDEWHDVRPTLLTVRLLAYRNGCWSLIVAGKQLEQAVKQWCTRNAQCPETLSYSRAKIAGMSQAHINQHFPDVRTRAIANSDYLEMIATSQVVRKRSATFRRKGARVNRFEADLLNSLVDAVSSRPGRSKLPRARW